jgi:hypothetical protein
MNQIKIIGSIMAATGKVVPDVASDNNFQKKLVYQVIKGESVNKAVRALISALIKKPEEEIWPEPAKEGK